MHGVRKLLVAGALGVLLSGVALAGGVIRYVDATATGANTGGSWADAYTEPAVRRWRPPAPGDEIWVAAGDLQADRDGRPHDQLRDEERRRRLRRIRRHRDDAQPARPRRERHGPFGRHRHAARLERQQLPRRHRRRERSRCRASSTASRSRAARPTATRRATRTAAGHVGQRRLARSSSA